MKSVGKNATHFNLRLCAVKAHFFHYQCHLVKQKINLFLYEQSNVPSLKIISKNNPISVEEGGYKWTTTEGSSKNTTIYDHASAEQIAHNMEGSKVLPQEKLHLTFTQKPNNVEVLYRGELKNVDYSFTNEIIIVPKNEGIYVFEIIGDWAQGRASYTIKIIVDNSKF